MKKLSLVIMLFANIFISATACTNKGHNDDIVASSKEYEMVFDFNNIDSVVYYEDDDAMCIHYDDPDVFDYENLAFLTDRDKWYGEYVSAYVDDTIITEFLNDYHRYLTSTDWEEKEELSNKYSIIEEDIRYKSGERDIIFFIRIAKQDEVNN